MAKTINILFPNENKADDIKIFQDQTSQIKGFYFKRSVLGEVKNFSEIENACIYFLFNQTEDGKFVYVGESTKGIERIKSHKSNKGFWSECILFTTNNNNFTKSTIDYLEYKFIETVKKGLFEIENSDLRINEPNINEFDLPTFLEYYDQINFLLKAMGYKLDEKEISKSSKVYYNKEKTASLAYQDGSFILLKGSLIKGVKQSCVTGEKPHIKTMQTIYDRQLELLNQGKIELIDENDKDIHYRTVVDIEAKSASNLAVLCTGRQSNGYVYFVGLDEIRKKNNIF